jgi:hypothetical protein
VFRRSSTLHRWQVKRNHLQWQGVKYLQIPEIHQGRVARAVCVPQPAVEILVIIQIADVQP